MPYTPLPTMNKKISLQQCVGNNGSSAGMISITCPTSMATLDQLESILTTPNYITYDVFR